MSSDLVPAHTAHNTVPDQLPAVGEGEPLCRKRTGNEIDNEKVVDASVSGHFHNLALACLRVVCLAGCIRLCSSSSSVAM